MKATLLFISAILAALTPLAASAEINDTVTTIIGADRIIITESPNGLKTVVSQDSTARVITQTYDNPGSVVVSHMSKSGLSLTGNRNNRNSSVTWEVISGGLGFGFCAAPGAPEAAGIEPGKSFELSWLNILAVQARNRHGNTFSLAVGINWRNYRTTLDHRFTVNDGQVSIENYPEGTEPRLSRIKIFSVQFPLLYRQQLQFGLFGSKRDKMSISFGPIFNLNSHASVLTAWRDGDVKSEYKVNGINVRPFTIDLFASLHVCDFCSFYVRYSPYHALTGHNQINFHQLSTGLMFLM